MWGLQFKSPSAIFSAERDCNFKLDISFSNDLPILPNSSYLWLICCNCFWSIDSGAISPFETVFKIISARDSFLLIEKNMITIMMATIIEIIVPMIVPILVSVSEILSRACFSTAEIRYQPVLSIFFTDARYSISCSVKETRVSCSWHKPEKATFSSELLDNILLWSGKARGLHWLVKINARLSGSLCWLFTKSSYKSVNGILIKSTPVVLVSGKMTWVAKVNSGVLSTLLNRGSSMIVLLCWIDFLK